MRSFSIQCHCEAFNRRSAVPIPGRRPPRQRPSRHGSHLRKRSAIFGEMRESTTRMVVRSLLSRACWRQVSSPAPIQRIFLLTFGQEHFKRRVAEAKKLVSSPIQVDGHPEMPRLKLKMSAKSSEPGTPRLTLKVAGQNSETPSKDDGPSGVAVDNESLKRQQALVRAGSASQDAEANRASPRTRSLRRHVGSPKSSATATPSGSEQHPGVSATARDLASVVKDETPMGSSQHAEMRASQGLHGLPLDPASGFSYEGKLYEPARSPLPVTYPWVSTGSAAC